MTIPYYNILDISLFGLKIIRQRPTDGILGIIINIIFEVLVLIFTVLTVMFFFEINGDIDNLAKATESLTTFSQTFIKLIPLLIYRKQIQRLFNISKHFWDIENFPELVPSFKKIYKNTFFFLVSYQCTLYMTCIFFYIQPFIKYDLLIVSHVPTQVPYAFEIMLATQYPIAFMLSHAMGGFDSMYVAYFTHLVVQLKCLNNAMENIDMKSPDFHQTLKKYMIYHKFILSFADELLHFVGIPLLGQYVISIYLTCMELYLLADSFGSPMRLILSLVYTTCLLFQFACYCFSATEFTDEVADIGRAAYMSKWYDGTPEQQRMICFIMLRAQKEVKCTAAGLVYIDRLAFLTVLKTAVSFYTLMKQFKVDE